MAKTPKVTRSLDATYVHKMEAIRQFERKTSHAEAILIALDEKFESLPDEFKQPAS